MVSTSASGQRLLEFKPALSTVEKQLPLSAGPLGRALLMYACACLILMLLTIHATEWHVVHPLDDTYISMAMAKNFAEHGIWGVTRFGFSSSTSTPFYVLLLSAAYWLTGASAWWPLALACIFGALSIVAAHHILPRVPLLSNSGLLALILLVPLPIIAQTAMEHTLHIFLSLLFVLRASPLIAEKRSMDWLLVAVTPCLVMTRYEGIFLVLGCAALLLLRRSPRVAMLLLLSAAVPIVAYGTISLSKGWFFLPNSLLLKGINIQPISASSMFVVFLHIFVLLRRAPHLLGVIVALAAMLYGTRKARQWSEERILLWLSLVAVIAHLAFADVGWVFRYEAYLIALSIVSITSAMALLRECRYRILIQLSVGICALLLVRRAYTAFFEMPKIAASVYSQQYQMARFVSRYYHSASLAANDIGAIAYAADIHLFDLTGLADERVLKEKRSGVFTTDAMQTEAVEKNTEIGIAYDDWFSKRPSSVFGGPPMPDKWVRVGRWRLAGRPYVGANTVSFYAVRMEATAELQAHFQAFTPSLPKTVEVLPD